MAERVPSPGSGAALAGTWIPVLTRYDQHDRIDHGALDEHVQRIVAVRPSGLYTHGTSGEFFNQTEAEWESVVERVASASAAAGLRCQIGASHTAPVTAMHRIAVAARLRPAAIQVILPDWTILSPDETRRALDGYQDAADGSDLVLYMPRHGKNQLSPEDLAQLFAEFPSLAGVKLVDGDANWYQRMRPVLADHAVYVPGHHLATGLAQGAAGSCSNVACLSPAGAVEWEAICRSEPDRGRHLEQQLLAFFAETIAPLQAKGYSGAALDKAMATAGGHLGPVGGMRWPLSSATRDEISSIRTAAARSLPEMFHPAVDTPRTARPSD